VCLLFFNHFCCKHCSSAWGCQCTFNSAPLALFWRIFLYLKIVVDRLL
jgi:hypothetical protein